MNIFINYRSLNLSYSLSKYNILINRSQKKLYLYENGNILKVYPIAIGKASTPTPLGNFTIINKDSNPGGVFGERWLGLSIEGYGIHGTNDPYSIGKAISHGCIRLYNKDIIELYNTVPIGTPVKITD